MFAVAQLHLRQMFAGSRRWLLLVCMAIPLPILTLIRTQGEFRSPVEEQVQTSVFLYAIYALALPALASMLYGTSIIGAEVQNQTLTYLFTRPIARWRVLMGKYLANVGILVALTTLSLTIGWAIVGAVSAQNLAAIAVATVFATATYNAVFALLGSIFTRRALIAGLAYLGVSEIALAWAPTFGRNFTAQYHMRSIAFELSDLEGMLRSELRALVSEVTTPVAVASVLSLCAVALIATCWITTSREFALTDDP
ncbi:MAG: ABC transporter permease [Planctomycetes bacterium]|nr:ABC transporter permease [Planctomycetota bacterium]